VCRQSPSEQALTDVQRVLDRAPFEIERAEEEPAFTKLVYLEGSL